MSTMEEEHLLGLARSESYLLEIQKLEFQEREVVREREYQERKEVREYQERKEEREREHMKVMTSIELEIAKLRKGRTFFSG